MGIEYFGNLNIIKQNVMRISNENKLIVKEDDSENKTREICSKIYKVLNVLNDDTNSLKLTNKLISNLAKLNESLNKHDKVIESSISALKYKLDARDRSIMGSNNSLVTIKEELIEGYGRSPGEKNEYNEYNESPLEPDYDESPIGSDCNESPIDSDYDESPIGSDEESFLDSNYDESPVDSDEEAPLGSDSDESDCARSPNIHSNRHLSESESDLSDSESSSEASESDSSHGKSATSYGNSNEDAVSLTSNKSAISLYNQSDKSTVISFDKYSKDPEGMYLDWQLRSARVAKLRKVGVKKLEMPVYTTKLGAGISKEAYDVKGQEGQRREITKIVTGDSLIIDKPEELKSLVRKISPSDIKKGIEAIGLEKILKSFKNYIGGKAKRPEKYLKKTFIKNFMEILQKHHLKLTGDNYNDKKQISKLIDNIIKTGDKQELEILKKVVVYSVNKQSIVALEIKGSEIEKKAVFKEEIDIINQIKSMMDKVNGWIAELERKKNLNDSDQKNLAALKKIKEWSVYLVKGAGVEEDSKKMNRRNVIDQGDSTSSGSGLVSEKYHLGSLKSLLGKKGMDGNELLSGLISAAKGLFVLHQLEIVHNDFATRNLVVTPKFHLVGNTQEELETKFGYKFGIIDWGLSAIISSQKESENVFLMRKPTQRQAFDPAVRNKDGSLKEKEIRRPLYSAAPERIYNGICSDKTDVWSFGVTLLESILENHHENYIDKFFPNRENAHDLTKCFLDAKTNKDRPNQHMMERLEAFQKESQNPVSKEVFELLTKIFHNDPAQRPTMYEIACSLEELQKVGKSLFLKNK